MTCTMRKTAILISCVFVCTCTSCFLFNKGHWVDGVCRPKKSKFSIQKVPFQKTEELVFNKVYTGLDIASFGYGFYPDGRLIFITSEDGFALKEKDVAGKDWNKTINIGYWRVEGKKIKIETFICNGGGYYLKEKGEIKGDTLVFYKNIYYPLKKEVREEKYVLSKWSFD